jgi:uncharacterized Fe-S cluster protein YjdI/CDGSH-type Zn-finger protein
MDEPEARARAGVAKAYANDRIAVTWEPTLCIHVARCSKGLPHVFDPQGRPWIRVDRATADEIAKVVLDCPSGALHYRRLDGGPQEEAPEETKVEARPNGPLFLRGRLTIKNARGEVVRQDTRLALCRCGQSKNKPFCDATHRAIGFQAP